jgi:phage tail-like protein
MSVYGRAEPTAEPYLNNSFQFEADGIGLQAFDDIEISDQEWTKIETRTGADPLRKQVSAGILNPVEITLMKKLREGNQEDLSELENWFKGGSSLANRKSGSIIFLDRQQNEIKRWNFKDGWISSFKRPKGTADDDTDTLDFSLTITVSDIEEA